MKTLFLTTRRPDAQGDYLELTLVHGLRKLLGDDFVEFPKKKILYGDFSESPREKLHGRGFSLCSSPIEDVSYDRSKLDVKDFDVVIHGSGHIYGDHWQVDHPNQYYTDGNDLYGTAPIMREFEGEHIIGCQFPDKKCFKRELIEPGDNLFPIGFGVPLSKGMPYNHNDKTQLFQSTAPTDACFKDNSAYKFDNEDEYYADMNRSWFGLTCKKGGWDCLRHYEILASGALLLFKDYNIKPLGCEPRQLPTFSYSTEKELYEIMNRLVVNGKPTSEYLAMNNLQHIWFMSNGTTIARAKYLVSKIGRAK